MELWIRSQNREKLIKVNQLCLHDSNIFKNDFLLNDKPNYSNISIVANDNYNLGSYKSKERALEVLDEIQCHLVIINDVRDRYFYVYEMPKE